MSLTNQVENRILIVGSMAVSIFAFWLILRLFIIPTYTAQIEFLQKQNAAKDATITELAKIAKYSIANDFGKMKAKEGSVITLDLDNTLDVENLQETGSATLTGDTVVKPPKKPPWKKIFGSKK